MYKAGMKSYLEFCIRFLALAQVHKKVVHFPVILGTHFMRQRVYPVRGNILSINTLQG